MNKTQEYKEMIDRHQKEIDDFPIGFVYSDSQLQEALKKVGAKSLDECVTVHRCGGILNKKDIPTFNAILKRHKEELHEAMKNPEFARAAFRYEMDNHEYAINWEGDADVLCCFGWSPKSFANTADITIQNAYLAARNEHIEHFRKLGVI